MSERNPYQDILNAPAADRKAVTESVYDRKYAEKVAKRGTPLPKKRRLKRIGLYESIIGTGHQRVLEMGCGLGDLTYRLVNCAERVVGVDISARALEIAKERAGLWSLGEDPAARIEFLQMSAVRLEFQNGSFDWALSASMIEHLRQMTLLLIWLKSTVF